jgi:putative holliday junction resolvase
MAAPDAPRSRPGRVVALDLGSKRIGVATSDLTQMLASPYEVILRRGDQAQDHKVIAALVEECEAVRVIIGLPLGLNGQAGKAAQLITNETNVLIRRLTVPVELFDERFTTTTAHQNLAANNIKAKDRRNVVDKAAAAVLLQAWLDTQANKATQAAKAAAQAAATRRTSQ